MQYIDIKEIMNIENKNEEQMSKIREFNLNSRTMARFLELYDEVFITDEELKEMYNMFKSRLIGLGGTTYDIDNMCIIYKEYGRIDLTKIPGVKANRFNIDGILGADLKGIYSLQDFNELLREIKILYDKCMQDESNILVGEIDKEFEEKLVEATYYINNSFVNALITPLINTRGDKDKIMDVLMGLYTGGEYHCELMTKKILEVFRWKENKDRESTLKLEESEDVIIEAVCTDVNNYNELPEKENIPFEFSIATPCNPYYSIY